MAESIATGCAANLLSEGLIWLFKKVVAPVKVLICLPRAVTQMERDVENVVNDKNVIEEELRGEQQRAKLRVSTWLETAETLRVSSRSISEMYDAHQQHKSYLGCCPKCLCRYRISKDIRNLNRSLAQLHSQRAHPDFPSSGQYGNPTPRTQIPITQTGIVPNAMRSKQTDDIERWLTDENSNVQRIGISGMGGVGKTSLLDAINNSQRVKSSFELIIKVIVSRNDISFLQKNVAERLNIQKFPENSIERVDTLRNFFKNKKYVILLDDMWLADSWTPDKLQELGVSFSDTGSKFVITTRDEPVCAMMNVQKTIKVEPLSEEQGWELFRSKAFVNQNGNVPYDIIEPVARRIAEECKGLPLAITVVAAAMTQHTALYEWEVALNQMKNVPETFYDLHSVIDKELFQRLRWSYNVLPDRLKPCFLYFAAYPEDAVIEVSEVIEMWISEGLVEECGDSYLQDIGNSYIKQLVDRCLIEVVSHGLGGRLSSVKIHDILRDLAIRIAEKEQRCFFKAGQSLESFNFEEVGSKDCVKLSLMRNDLQSLPTTFPFRSLSVLLLNKNHGITEVPESFLCELPSLKVLDLSDTGITSLPPSIRNLKHLASLQLQRTNIRELPEDIGDLTELQFLNLTSCQKLLCLPEKISDLKRLRVLHLHACVKLTHLPRGIKKLISLEILTMRFTRIEWDFERDANAEGASACLNRDLQNFRRLRALSAQIKSPVNEGVRGNWSNMRELCLRFVGANGHNYLLPDMHVMKDLESFTLYNCDVERMPHFPKLEDLWVYSCKQLKELPSEFMPCLTALHIFECDKLELELGFPKLERLDLDALDSLECVGPVGTMGAASGSGGLGEGASQLPPMLKTLYVVNCPKLKRLRGRWDQITHLESIECSREWWDAIECDDPDIKTLLQNKCVFDRTVLKWSVLA